VWRGGGGLQVGMISVAVFLCVTGETLCSQVREGVEQGDREEWKRNPDSNLLPGKFIYSAVVFV
jgi:hypothetical protein